MNNTEREAVKLLLKRYDMLSAWRLVFRPFVYNTLCSVTYAMTILFFIVSFVVFFYGTLFETIFGSIINFDWMRVEFLYFFSQNTLNIFIAITLVFLLVSSLRNQRLITISNSKFSFKVINRSKKSIFKIIGSFILVIIGLLIIIPTPNNFFFGLFILLMVLISMYLTRRRYFILSVFLPRIIISVTYIWTTYVLSEESSRLFYGLNNSTYSLIFIVSMLGTLIFLYFEAQQYAPSAKWSTVLWKKVLPVFCYTVTIAVVFGLIVNSSLGTTRTKQADAVTSSFLSDTLQNIKIRKEKILELDSRIVQLQTQEYNLPNIPIETKLQSLTNSDRYSKRYNNSIKQLNANFINLKVFIKSTRNFNGISEKCRDLLVTKIESWEYDTLELTNLNYRRLRKQDSIYYANQIKIDFLLNEATKYSDSLNDITWKGDSLFSNTNEVLNDSSGYYYFIDTAKINTIIGQNDNNKKIKNSRGLFTKFPLNLTIYKFERKEDKDLFTINLKSFLIQVAVAIALGVIGQLIISDKTATEAL